MYVVHHELAGRTEASEAAHWASLVEGLAAMPGNPYRAQVRRFGSAVALRCPGMPSRSFVNRVLCAGSGEELAEAVAWVREAGVRCRVDVTPFQGASVLEWLAQQGFRQLGFQMALVGQPALVSAPAVEVRTASSNEEWQFAARAVSTTFDAKGHWVGWLADSLLATADRPDWRTYIAYVDGQMAGFAQLHIADGVGSPALAGTLPAFRGRGVQTALIRRRIADAAAAGCDLICTQTGNGTVSQHNMERLGLRIAYSKAEFYEPA